MFSKELKAAVTPDFTKNSDCAKKLLSIKKKYPFKPMNPNEQDRMDLKEYLFDNALRIVNKEYINKTAFKVQSSKNYK